MTKNQKEMFLGLLIALVIVAIILFWGDAFNFTHHSSPLSNAINEGLKQVGAK